jgi:hypothetical protein
MNNTTIIILVFADLVAGFLIWLYVMGYLNQFSWWKAALIKSFVYALFFGIGAFGEGGGEPGFMLPAPILPAAIISLSESKLYDFIQNALLPYSFWVLVLFTFFYIRQAIRHLKKSKAIA